jgi:hypothetical protein
LAAIGIAAVTPMSVVAAGIPLGFGHVKQLGIPAGYATISMIVAVFVVGLSAMARHVPNSGAFYSYVAAGLSRPFGVGTGGVALVAYSAMNIGLYGAFGVAAVAAMRLFGVGTNWRAMVIAAWLAISLLGQLRIGRNAHLLGLSISAEVLIVLVFGAVMLAHPADGNVSVAALNPLLLANAEGAGTLVGAIAGLRRLRGPAGVRDAGPRPAPHPTPGHLPDPARGRGALRRVGVGDDRDRRPNEHHHRCG